MEYNVQKHLHYAGIPSFNLYPVTRELDNVDIAIMGVPFDSGVTNRPGARLGPRAIRNMSQLTNCFAYPWDYKLSENANIIDYFIFRSKASYPRWRPHNPLRNGKSSQ